MDQCSLLFQADHFPEEQACRSMVRSSKVLCKVAPGSDMSSGASTDMLSGASTGLNSSVWKPNSDLGRRQARVAVKFPVSALKDKKKFEIHKCVVKLKASM